jgi:ketosteroid isomerase-like protein
MSRTTIEVIKSHGRAFRLGINAILLDYAPDAVIISPSGVHQGHAQIRPFFESEIMNFPTGFWEALKTRRLEVHGEYGYFLWEALPWYPLGCDSFHVRDGLIRFQSSTI